MAKKTGKKRLGLVLGGGAPNLPLMSGALLALHEAGAEFKLISTTGAGMLVGLLYAAPKHGDPVEALRATRDMGVHDLIYQMFPVNFKVFHKPGPLAEMWSKMTLPWLAQFPRKTSTERLMADSAAFWTAMMSPGDLTSSSKGLCQPPPWIEEAVDFERLREFPGLFRMTAWSIDRDEEVTFNKHQITAEHFKAALAMPLIYSPYQIDGETFLEGSAFDTLEFAPGELMEIIDDHVDTLIYFDVLGHRNLVRAPRDLYDAWVLSIINPLVRLAELNLQVFNYEREKRGLKVDLKGIPFGNHIDERQWPLVLDWSYSNMSELFDDGYDAAEDFLREFGEDLGLRVPPGELKVPLSERRRSAPV